MKVIRLTDIPFQWEEFSRIAGIGLQYSCNRAMLKVVVKNIGSYWHKIGYTFEEFERLAIIIRDNGEDGINAIVDKIIDKYYATILSKPYSIRDMSSEYVSKCEIIVGGTKFIFSKPKDGIIDLTYEDETAKLGYMGRSFTESQYLKYLEGDYAKLLGVAVRLYDQNKPKDAPKSYTEAIKFNPAAYKEVQDLVDSEYIDPKDVVDRMPQIYDSLNRAFFSNTLPVLKRFGLVAGKKFGARAFLTEFIEFNSSFIFRGEAYIKIFVHEMIHTFIHNNGIVDDSVHGRKFELIRSLIYNTSKIDIPSTESYEGDIKNRKRLMSALVGIMKDGTMYAIPTTIKPTHKRYEIIDNIFDTMEYVEDGIFPDVDGLAFATNIETDLDEAKIPKNVRASTILRNITKFPEMDIDASKFVRSKMLR